MNLRILKALVKKEALQIIRDPSAILIAFILPLILLFIFGYGVNLDSNRIRVGLVVEADNTAVDSLIQSFLGSRFLDITYSKSRHTFKQALTEGTYRGIIVIPQNFSVERNRNQTAQIQVISDGSQPSIAQFVNNYASGVVNVWVQQQLISKGESVKSLIELQPRFWYNPELKSRNFLIPGSIAIIMTLIGTLLTALVIAREWERGTMESLMSTPIKIHEILLGKLIPYFILGMGSMLLCLIVAHQLFAIPFRGNLWVLMLTTAVFLLTGLGQGMLISSLTRDQFVASQAALMSAFLPAFMLSGFIFEIAAMPKVIQLITYLFAARYFVTSLQTIFLTGNVWPLLLKCLLAMSIIGVIFFTVTALKNKKRLD